MTEPGNMTGFPTPTPQRGKKYRPLVFIGYPLMILGIVTATMNTMNHLKQQPPEPLILDLTLARGYGGFIAYGVAAALLGFTLGMIGTRSRKAAEPGVAPDRRPLT
jgi:hypothetical protein